MWLASFEAHAIGAEGEPIDTSNFTLDLHQGPVLAGSRVVGLGGAYVPIAEGVAGYAFNPAAVALRVPWSTDYLDWDLDGGFTLPSSVTQFDFDNNGDDGFSNDTAFFLTAGLGLQAGPGGVGANVEWQLYKVGAGDQAINVNIWRPVVLGGYSLLDGELVIGLGVGLTIVDIDRDIPLGGSNETRDVASVAGPSFHGGVLWAPTYAPVRLGVSGRWSLPPSAQPDARPTCVDPCVTEGSDFYIPDSTKPSGRFYLPRTVAVPSEIWAGAAVQLFRQFNHSWVDPRLEPSAYRYLAARIERARQKRRSEPGFSEAEDETLREKEEEQLAEAKRQDRQLRLAPYKEQPREKLLISVAARITFVTETGIGLDSFLSQVVERSGKKATVGPHFGAESEVWPGNLVLRAGSYLEPTRFASGPNRWHGTGGLDWRLPFTWSVFGLMDEDTSFRIGGAVDGTVRYFGWNVSAGIWR